MVSKASEDFPDPLSPVITVKVFRGISTSIFFRLCCRAPCTVMRSSIEYAQVSPGLRFGRTNILAVTPGFVRLGQVSIGVHVAGGEGVAATFVVLTFVKLRFGGRRSGKRINRKSH